MQIFLLEISLLGAVFRALSSRSKEIYFNWLLLLLSCLLFPRPLFVEVKLDNSTQDVPLCLEEQKIASKARKPPEASHKLPKVASLRTAN